ncbi:MAG: ATP-binding protein [Treponema sp.]|jgi:hypothetical protein|nr:ATP-binding protein [Treponema sp.]
MLCAALIVWDDSSLPVSKIRRLVDAPVCASLESGEHRLFSFGLVEHDNDRGFSDTENYRLSEQACEELLRDVEYSGKIKVRPPGTGKTETVYQIARETGRDIMRVDISDTKSKWFGESEKSSRACLPATVPCSKKRGKAPRLYFFLTKPAACLASA